jgi:hypothetical protein
MSKELDSLDHYEIMNKVMIEYHKGNTNPTTLARTLGIKRAEALDYIAEWKDIAKNDINIRDQAREVLQGAIQHNALLKEEAHTLLQQSDDAEDLKNKTAVIKLLSDLDSKAVEMLQKAGLYDDAALGDEIAEMEEKAEAIKQLLKQVAEQYPEARHMIMQGLTKIFNEASGMPVTIEGETTPKA